MGIHFQISLVFAKMMLSGFTGIKLNNHLLKENSL